MFEENITLDAFVHSEFEGYYQCIEWAQDIRAPSCNMLTLLSVSETMVGSLISRAHLPPALVVATAQL